VGVFRGASGVVCLVAASIACSSSASPIDETPAPGSDDGADPPVAPEEPVPPATAASFCNGRVAILCEDFDDDNFQNRWKVAESGGKISTSVGRTGSLALRADTSGSGGAGGPPAAATLTKLAPRQSSPGINIELDLRLDLLPVENESMLSVLQVTDENLPDTNYVSLDFDLGRADVTTYEKGKSPRTAVLGAPTKDWVHCRVELDFIGGTGTVTVGKLSAVSFDVPILYSDVNVKIGAITRPAVASKIEIDNVLVTPFE
jgi:hypothetical protein